MNTAVNNARDRAVRSAECGEGLAGACKRLRPTGGHRALASFRASTLIYDPTYWFCGTFPDPHSRLVDQMVMAARSGRRNLAEGYCSEQFAVERLARRQTQVRRDSVDRSDPSDPSDQHRLRPQTTEDGAGNKPPAGGVPAPARGHETLTAQTDMANLDT